VHSYNKRKDNSVLQRKKKIHERTFSELLNLKICKIILHHMPTYFLRHLINKNIVLQTFKSLPANSILRGKKKDTTIELFFGIN